MSTNRPLCVCGQVGPHVVSSECAFRFFDAAAASPAPIPKAPDGYQTCNVHDGAQNLWANGATRQISHLVAVPTGGPTVCGLTRFGADADLPGWSMGGGVSGPGIEQVRCEACWALAASSTPLEPKRPFPVACIWRVSGDDHNVFGVPCRRNLEAVGTTEAEARADAQRRFPDMQITECHPTSKDSIL